LIGSGAVAVLLALKGFGVWSLVGQSLVSVALTVVLAGLACRWLPKLAFSWPCFRELFGFSSHVLGFQVLNYFARNLDNLLIGKFLGATALGYYSLAYRLMLYPLQNVSWTLSRVLFPAFSQIQSDLVKVRQNYLRVIRYISLATFPMMAGMAVVAPELIRVLYGSQWERSIFLVQVLCVVGFLQSIGTTVGTIYLSQGRSDLMLKWNLFIVPIVCLAIIVGLRWDVEGVALCYTAVGLVFWYLSHSVANRLIHLSMSKFLQALVPTGAAAVAMAMLLALWRLAQERVVTLENWQSLVIQVTLGSILYFGILRLLRSEIFDEIAEIFRGRRSPKHEIRNSKQIPMTKAQNSKPWSVPSVSAEE
jgi:PST family polysaccharide transporter